MKKLSRETILFFALTQLFAWLGLYLKQVRGIDGAELLFLCMPLLLAIGFHRLNPQTQFFKRLKKLNIKAAWRWYLFALTVYPLSYLLITGLGLAFGLITTSGWQSYIGLVSAAFPSAYVFACFEELTWRGWLEPSLEADGLTAFEASLITGIIWALWHAPLFAFAYYEIYAYQPMLSFMMS